MRTLFTPVFQVRDRRWPIFNDSFSRRITMRNGG
jgi:hypothetical protein